MICVRLELTLWATRALLFVGRSIAAVLDVFAPRLRPSRAGHSNRRIQW